MPVEHVSLCRCRVLYLGSAIPLETAVGIESLQAPCRDRYDNVDSNQKASGIDSSLSVYSSGLMLQYAADESSTTWFPIQTLHVCAAVKAVGGGGPLRFVSLDAAAAQRSSNPPLFACIMRRTKGVKVLECHVFVCKSNQAAMALVQSCTHAFEHKEGWMTSQPSGGTRIIAASGASGGKGTMRGGGFFSERSDLVQKFDVSCKVDDKPTAAPAQPCVQPMMMVPMNPPGAPICQPGMPMEYFADWNMYGGQPLMIIPNSPFYPGDAVIQKTKKKKKKPKKKVEDSGSETEETFYIKKSDLGGGSICGDSLRSRIKGRHGHGHGHGVHIEEIVQPCPPAPAPPPPKPCPPQIIFMPQPAPPPQPGPSFKNQQNPNTDVVVYAPQVIEANKRTENYQYDDRDTSVVDYHPDNRSYRASSDRRLYDGRADNRINYNRQNYRKDDYRADQRQFTNREDNRRLDYRGDFRSNREDNRNLSYRADNRSNRMSNQQAAEYNMYEPGYDYDYEAAQKEEEFQQGYYDAQVQEYNQKLAEYNRQMAEYYDEEDDGYYPEEEYCSQPGFTDDYGVADYTRHLPAPAPEGRYELDYVDDYVVQYGPPTQAPTAGRDRFNQVADGLGYYP
jgi:hypothetical protein